MVFTCSTLFLSENLFSFFFLQKLLTILFCGLLAFTYAQEEPSQFSDLIGQQAIVKAEKQLLSEDEEEIETKIEENEVANEENKGFTSFLFGLYDLENPEAKKENTSPSRDALGFGSKPMSFKQNFEKDFQFDKSKKSRVKRSRLNDLQAAASAQRFAGIDPAIIAQMFQRQLLIAEDAGLPVHDAVPLPAQPVQPVHPQPVTHAPHMPHHQPVSHVMPHHSGHHVSIQTKDHHISHGTSTQGKHKYIRVGSYSKITF